MQILKVKGQPAIIQRLVKGTFWSLTGSVVSKCLVLLSTAIVTHILSQGEYGRVGLIRTTIQMFSSLLGLGMGATASKYIAQYRQDNFPKAFKMYLVSNLFAWFVGILSCLVIVACAPWIAGFSLHDESLTAELRLGGLILLFCVINGAQQGTLAGFEDFKGIAIVNLLMGVCEVVFLYLGSSWGGVGGTLLGFGLVYFTVAGLNFLRIRKHISYDWSYMFKMMAELRPRDFKVVITFSLPVALSSLVCVPALWWSKTFLAGEVGYEAVAVFDIADQWKGQILFIPATIAAVLLPIVSSSKQRSDSVRVLKFNLGINIIVTLLLSALIFAGRDVIMQFYGESYTNSWPLFILSLTAILTSISNVLGTAFFAIGKPMKVLFCNTLLGVAVVVFSYISIRQNHSEDALAYAHLWSYLVFVLCLSVFSYYNFKHL
ncbi:MAG: oligosaccharide flippase family protein [Paraprevotella sp.]|nr:oligosaccharide flippase family protein [Paraprevotella sp.]MBP3471885.1 oligosaccharide flippase family protein [Paraprevotella sp.]